MADPQWPPANGLGTPTVPREQAILTSCSSIRVKAPASLVFQTVCETSQYSTWNTFVPNVKIHSQPSDTPADSAYLIKGTSFTFDVVMDSKKPTKITPTQLLVTDVSTPDNHSAYIHQDVLNGDASYTADLSKVYRISWKSEGGFVSRGLRTERFHEIIVLGDNECEVRTWEVMGGLVARTVKWLYQDTLRQKFQLWCEDLKIACEKTG